LLDGGVHYVAATRYLLGENEENAVKTASAFTVQLQEHLPPIDTLNATLRTKAGVSGTFSVSFGTTFRENSYQLAFEKGAIVVEDSSCKLRRPGTTEPEVKKLERANGVAAEIKEWAEGLKSGRLDVRQSANEALKDLILLEAMFKSGEQDGAAVSVP
jgi:predicted dehydrogenase